MSKNTVSGTAVPPRGITKVFTFWQDREIRFDATSDVFSLRPNAEEVLATFHQVEDSKGNGGQTGTLLVTNLRLLWWSARQRSVNLSIGYYCVLNVTVQETQSKLFGGNAEALFVSCKFGSSRFMFVFTYVPSKMSGGDAASSIKTKLFATVSAAWRAYDSTRVYREIRLRTAIIANHNLILLEGEQVMTKAVNVTNVSKDSGHSGTLITTNLRLVWFAATTDNFNVSIPYMQFTAVRSQNSRFGPALVVETSSYAGNFVLGFRVEPISRLDVLYQEIASLWKAWTARPLLGMQIAFSEAVSHNNINGLSLDGLANEENFHNDTEDGNGVNGNRNGNGVGAAAALGVVFGTGRTRDTGAGVLEQAPGDAFAAYYADEGQKGVDRKPAYDKSIGLAVEKLRKGVTLQELWSVTIN